ncbi:MAG: ABC transporter permease subunit [Chloroflexi bacterium]|nr:ABC transporter permease subunit [Chloroflexota bacterium]
MDHAQRAPQALQSSLTSASLETLSGTVIRAVRSALIAAAVLIVVALFFGRLFGPLWESLNVDESFSETLAGLASLLLPLAVYLSLGMSARPHRKQNAMQAMAITIVLATIAAVIFYTVGTLQGGEAATEQSSLQFAATQTDDGIVVDAVEPGGAAEQAGLLPGDIITALRRDPITLARLNTAVVESDPDTPFRLRILRGGEEVQLTVRTAAVAIDASGIDFGAIASAWVGGVAVALIGLFGPPGWTPYILLTVSLSPLILGFAWLTVATFSYRTQGLLPVDAQGNVGGLTLENWSFLGIGGQAPATPIWSYAANSLFIAVLMTGVTLVLCSMAGYALSRMEFSGRRFFLSLTLILHSFPAVTLLIPVYLVLLNLGRIPIIGPHIGFNSIGGIALVMVAFGLPFGVWLMKGFFDNISWDMERSALIDGASRWRTFWEIILPQIRPGLLALGIFSFIGGWNAYLIPAIFSVGTKAANLPVYIRTLTGDTNPINWNQVVAVGVFQLIPILVIFVFAQEYLLNIYSGGSKGSS